MSKETIDEYRARIDQEAKERMDRRVPIVKPTYFSNNGGNKMSKDDLVDLLMFAAVVAIMAGIVGAINTII